MTYMWVGDQLAHSVPTEETAQRVNSKVSQRFSSRRIYRNNITEMRACRFWVHPNTTQPQLAPTQNRYYHNGMRFEFTDSADKHGIPHADAEYAVLHHVDYEILQPRRPGEQSFMFVGLPHALARRYLEVGVAVDGRGRRLVFHAMEVTDLYRHLLPPTDQ